MVKINKIKELRELMGIKQADFAHEFNVSQGTLSNWERGVHDPDNESLKKMREKFNKTSDYILGLSDDPTPPNKKTLPTQADAVRIIAEERNLSPKSKAELEEYIKLLEIRDQAQKLNEEASKELKPKLT